MKKNYTFVLIIVLSLSLNFISCVKKDSDKNKITLELTIWGSYKEVKIINDLIHQFHQQYTNVRVITTQAPAGQAYIDKLLTRTASQSLPDVIFCEVNFIDKFIEKKILMDISSLVAHDKDVSEDDYFPLIINRFKKDKKLFGLPRDTAPFACIYYNKDLFNKAGLAFPDDNWDISRFLATAKKLTVFDQKKNLYKQYGFYGWSWQNFLYTFNGKIVDNIQQPTKCLLDQKQALAALTFYRDLIYKYHVMPAPASMETGATELFMTGKIAMYNSGIWDTPLFRDIKNFKWDVAMFPKGPDGQRGFGTGGSGYAVSATSKHPKMAYELLKILSGAEGQVQLAVTGLAQPALKKLAYGQYWALDKQSLPANKSMLNQAVQYIVYNPYLPEWNEYEQKYINPVIDQVLRDQKTVQQGLQEITKKINDALQKRQNMD